MNLIDASVWLEYFAGAPLEEELERLVEAVETVLVPTVVLLEVTRRVMQQRGEDSALQVAAILHQGQIADLDSAVALSAAQLGVAHKLPLAESIIYATARQFGATLWTMGADFEGLPDVRYLGKRQ